MQEDALISQWLVYDHLLQSEKEVWEFSITSELRKRCKLGYQKRRLDEQKKKEAWIESEKELKRKHMTDEIENFKRQIRTVEKSVGTPRKNLVSEAIASDGNQDHAVKAASFAKTLVEK